MADNECTHHWTVTSECPFCQRQEIERLRAEITECRDDINRVHAEMSGDIHWRAKEIGRLRSLLREWRSGAWLNSLPATKDFLRRVDEATRED